MSNHAASRSLGIGLLALLLLLGCGGRQGVRTGKVNRDPNTLLVYVACSLTPSVEAARDQFVAANPGKSVQVESEEPLKLVERIEGGAVPDVLVLPGEAEIGLLEREGHLDGGSRTAMGELRMAVIARRGNPDQIRAASDLVTDRFRYIGMAAPGVTSPGTDGKRALEQAGLWDKIQPKLFLQERAADVLTKLEAGEVQAAIIYDPCPRLASAEKTKAAVEIACLLSNPETATAHVYAVVHKRSPNALLAQRLLRILAEQKVVADPPPPEAEAAPAPAAETPASP
jgi:molybdate transport system substrate-binding protein